MIRILKLNTRFVWPLVKGEKTFEVRRDDRGYEVGDYLQFLPVDDEGNVDHGSIAPCIPTWEEMLCGRIWKATYILRHTDFPDGIAPGYCVIGLKPIDAVETCLGLPDDDLRERGRS